MPNKGSFLWAIWSSGNCSSQSQWYPMLVEYDNKIPKDSGGQRKKLLDRISLPHAFTASSHLVQKHWASKSQDNPKFEKPAVEYWKTAIESRPTTWETSTLINQLAPQDPNYSVGEEGLLSFCQVFHPDDLSFDLHPAHPAIIRKPSPLDPHSNMAEQHSTKQV